MPSSAQPRRDAPTENHARLVVALAGAEPRERVTGAHRHAHGQLFGAVAGLLTVGTRRGQWIVPATHAVWVPPHEPHSMRSHGPFTGWSVYVAEAACEHLPATPRAVRTNELLRAAIERAVRWPDGPLDADRLRLAAVIVDEIRAAPEDRCGLPAPSDPRLLRVTRRLAAAPGDPRSLEDWAAVAAVSPRTLSRRFVAETGFTFSQWRQRARLMRGAELVSAGQPVTRVALELGYENVSAFIAAFKRTFGTTPARFAGGQR